MTTIITKNGTGVPADSSLSTGELAVDTTNGKLYTSSNGTNVVNVGSSTGIDDNATATAMTLDASGNVGIGGTPNNNSGYTTLTLNGNTDGAAIEWEAAGVRDALIYQNGDSDLVLQAESTNELVFNTSGSNERMRIDSSGNVGIGTTDPQNTFVVSDGNDGLEFRTSLTDDNRITSYNRGTSAFTRMSLSAADFTFLAGASNNPVVAIQSDANVRIGGTGQGLLTLQGPASGAEGGQLDIQCASGLGTYSIDTYSDDMRFLMTPTAGKYQWYCNANSLQAMTLDASGSLLVGATVNASSVPGVKILPAGRINLRIDSGGANAVVHAFYNNSTSVAGYISSTSTTTSYVTTSDVRLKENIVDAPSGNIDALKVRSFDWKADGSHQEYGFVAQELDEVAPYAVSKGGTEDDTWGVDYSKLVPMLVKEIQDLKAEVAALKGA